MFSHTLPVHLTFHALANCVWEPLIKRALAYSLGAIITSTHPTAKHDEVWVVVVFLAHTQGFYISLCAITMQEGSSIKWKSRGGSFIMS